MEFKPKKRRFSKKEPEEYVEPEADITGSVEQEASKLRTYAVSNFRSLRNCV